MYVRARMCVWLVWHIISHVPILFVVIQLLSFSCTGPPNMISQETLVPEMLAECRQCDFDLCALSPILCGKSKDTPMCVYMIEREREREGGGEREREKEREREEYTHTSLTLTTIFPFNYSCSNRSCTLYVHICFACIQTIVTCQVMALLSPARVCERVCIERMMRGSLLLGYVRYVNNETATVCGR